MACTRSSEVITRAIQGNLNIEGDYRQQEDTETSTTYNKNYLTRVSEGAKEETKDQEMIDTSSKNNKDGCIEEIENLKSDKDKLRQLFIDASDQIKSMDSSK